MVSDLTWLEMLVQFGMWTALHRVFDVLWSWDIFYIQSMDKKLLINILLMIKCQGYYRYPRTRLSVC